MAREEECCLRKRHRQLMSIEGARKVISLNFWVLRQKIICTYMVFQRERAKMLSQ